MIILFAFCLQKTSNTGGFWVKITEWIQLHAIMVSAVVKGISMLAGMGFVCVLYNKETPVIKITKACKKDIPYIFLAGALAGLSVNILFALIHFTDSSKQYEQVAKTQFALPVWGGIILYGVVSPLAEEMIFRGFVYKRLYKQYTRMIAIIGSSIVFGMYHGNIVQALYAFCLGLLIALFYEKYDTFLVPVILHGAANICIYIVTSSIFLQKFCMNWSGFFVCAGISGILVWKCLFRKNK